MISRILVVIVLCFALLLFCYGQDDDFWTNVNVVEHEIAHDKDEEVREEIVDTLDEEFDNVQDMPTVKETLKKTQKKTEQQQPPQQPTFLALPQQEHFYYEIAILVGLVLYFVNFFIGATLNKSIVTKFADEYDEIFEVQFSSVERDGIRFEKIAQYLYKAWVTGRVGCEGCMISINTLYRHDLITRIYDALFSGNTFDTVTFDIKLDPVLVQNVILSIQPKSQQATHIDQNYDIRHFAPAVVTTTKSQQNLPSNRVIMTDTPELVSPHLEKRQDNIMQRVYDVLKEHESLFIGLHISDEFPDHMNATGGRTVIQLVCKLPSNVKRIEPLVKLAFDLIDIFTVELKIHSKIQERNRKLREEKRAKLRQEKLAQEEKKVEKKDDKSDVKKTKKKRKS
jgi:hypothetical protein